MNAEFYKWTLMQISKTTSVEAAQAYANSALELHRMESVTTVSILDVGLRKIEVLKTLRNFIGELTLAEAKSIVDSSVPIKVFEGDAAKAEDLARSLQDAGAAVKVRPKDAL